MFEPDFDTDESLPWLPDVADSRITITSPQDADYNCIGWALSCDDEYVWPGGGLTDAGLSWPDEVPRQLTLPAFDALFKAYGYEPCLDASVDSGYDKIALYATNGRTPSHAARQLGDGRWTSKLGDLADVAHDDLDVMHSRAYGRDVGYYRRAREGPTLE